MRINATKRALLEGKAVFGTIAFFHDGAAIEIAGVAGLDFVILDAEHSTLTIETIEQLVRAAELSGVSPFLRVGEPNANAILHALDAGVQGIMVPHIDTADDARMAVDAVRYPPKGNRGTWSTSRAARFGTLPGGLKQHVQESNDAMLLMGIIEGPKGVENIDAILDVSGIDVICVGRGDLATALGVPGQWDHPSVTSAVDQVFRAVSAREGIYLATVTSGGEDARGWAERGCRFFIYLTDYQVLLNGYRSALAKMTPMGA